MSWQARIVQFYTRGDGLVQAAALTDLIRSILYPGGRSGYLNVIKKASLPHPIRELKDIFFSVASRATTGALRYCILLLKKRDES